MSGAFRPVNSHLTTPSPDVKQEDMPSPSSPQQPMAGSQLERPPPTTDDATTPTRASFHASLSAQKSLPSSPFPQAVQLPNNDQQPLVMRVKGEDVEMEEPRHTAAETEAGPQQDEGASDDESVNADGTRSNKKKKSQRFYCTGYPPCNLSFTRSEHLARHIRKHTGERPFKCHCSRRFSRLDNLRQHAQTVHINEDIPHDSLAASGSRYQRQIRTDRVRPTTGRARANTAGSIGAPIRGHSKSLSTSSINSIGSVGSVFAPRDDLRHRPPPLVMADHRTRLSMESYQSNGDSSYTSYRHPSPGDFSTPTSATFSTNQSSPRWSAMASPTSAHSRSHSMLTDNRVMGGRRLSVPSGANPFQQTHGGVPGRQMMPANSPHPQALSPHNTHFMTPPSSGWSSRRDSISTTASEEAWRRRTWHPDTRNFAAPASTLDRVATAELIHLNPPQAPPQNPNMSIRLPGIESFTSVARPLTPPRRAPSPMAVDTEMGGSPQTYSADSDDRRGLPHWDIHRGLTRLDISKNVTPPRDGAGAWAKETDRAMQAQAEQARTNLPTVRFQPEPPPNYPPPEARGPPRAYHQHTLSAPSITTPRESKRHGWYHGPVHAVPEHPTQGDLGHDPNSRPYKIDRMVHPNVAAFPGFPAREAAQPQPSPQQSGQGSPESHRRLDALVAVATSEGKTAAAH